MICVCCTKNGGSSFLLDQQQLRPDSAMCTIIVMCHVFKQDARSSQATYFKSCYPTFACSYGIPGFTYESPWEQIMISSHHDRLEFFLVLLVDLFLVMIIDSNDSLLVMVVTTESYPAWSTSACCCGACDPARTPHA